MNKKKIFFTGFSLIEVLVVVGIMSGIGVAIM